MLCSTEEVIKWKKKTVTWVNFWKLRFIQHINILSIDVWFVMIGQYLAEIQLLHSLTKINVLYL